MVQLARCAGRTHSSALSPAIAFVPSSSHARSPSLPHTLAAAGKHTPALALCRATPGHRRSPPSAGEPGFARLGQCRAWLTEEGVFPLAAAEPVGRRERLGPLRHPTRGRRRWQGRVALGAAHACEPGAEAARRQGRRACHVRGRPSRAAARCAVAGQARRQLCAAAA